MKENTPTFSFGFLSINLLDLVEESCVKVFYFETTREGLIRNSKVLSDIIKHQRSMRYKFYIIVVFTIVASQFKSMGVYVVPS